MLLFSSSLRSLLHCFSLPNSSNDLIITGPPSSRETAFGIQSSLMLMTRIEFDLICPFAPCFGKQLFYHSRERVVTGIGYSTGA
jgi:hypothetical protein